MTVDLSEEEVKVLASCMTNCPTNKFYTPELRKVGRAAIRKLKDALKVAAEEAAHAAIYQAKMQKKMGGFDGGDQTRT
jgi:hypothetical protein